MAMVDLNIGRSPATSAPRPGSSGQRWLWPAAGRGALLIDIWLIVILVDRLSFPAEAASVLGVLSLAAALAALLSRHSGLALAALGLDAVHLVQLLPDIANHLTLLIWIEIALIVLLLAWIRRPGDGDIWSVWVRRTEAVIGLMIVTLYVVSAIHKMNSAYLDPAVSCARFITDQTLAWLRLGSSGSSLATANIWIGVGLELAIPVLLLLARTRLLALAVGLGFHGILALAPIGGVASFSMFMVASYVVFFDDQLTDRLLLWRKLIPARLASAGLRTQLLTGVVLAALVTAVNITIPGANKRLVRVIVALLLAAALVAVVSSWRRRRRWTLDWSPTWVAVVPVAFILVAATLPYLGGRTQLAFSMFSNLRTETSSNHHFLPAASLFGYQTDLVTIAESPARVFNDVSGPDLVVPAYEVGRRLTKVDASALPAMKVTDDGVEKLLTYDELVERFPPPSWLEAKLFRMRATESVGPVSCRH